jgi:hypothetical protein
VEVWYFFLGFGTILFGWNLMRHPRAGSLLGISGIFMGVVILVVTLVAFPFTPEDIGIPYIYGPLTGLWYMVQSVRMLRSLGWARNTFSLPQSSAA